MYYCNLKHQLSTQHCELSTTAHVVRKLQMMVVAFRTTIPNHSSIIPLFGCFWYLDFDINDLYCIWNLCCQNNIDKSSLERNQQLGFMWFMRNLHLLSGRKRMKSNFLLSASKRACFPCHLSVFWIFFTLFFSQSEAISQRNHYYGNHWQLQA
jgi:hypothetical protein